MKMGCLKEKKSLYSCQILYEKEKKQMDSLMSFFQTLIPFLGVLTLLVFVHELGHYGIARWNGVKVEVFSVGFGPELFGYTDKQGTRWKFGLLPLGGYVRMLGDEDASSFKNQGAQSLSTEDKKRSLHFKHPSQRIAVSMGGPLANFLLAWVLLAGLFMSQGRPFYPPIVGMVSGGSVAEKVGLQKGDWILRINQKPVALFEDIQKILKEEKESSLVLEIQRDGSLVALDPFYADVKKTKDRLGREHTSYFLGIGREQVAYAKMSVGGSLTGAIQEIAHTIWMTFVSLKEMILGIRDDGLVGPLRIAQMSGQMARLGMAALCLYAAMLSISLGLLNLFPIPMLDGGHVIFNLVEWMRGRPVSEKAQEYSYWVGFLIVLSLMLFSTWNDLKFWRIMDMIKVYFK